MHSILQQELKNELDFYQKKIDFKLVSLLYTYS